MTYKYLKNRIKLWEKTIKKLESNNENTIRFKELIVMYKIEIKKKVRNSHKYSDI